MDEYSLQQEISALTQRLRDVNRQVNVLPTPAQTAQIESLNAQIAERRRDLDAYRTDISGSDLLKGFTGAPHDLPQAPSPSSGGAEGGDVPPSPPPEFPPPVGSATGPDLSQPIHLAPPVPGETVFLPLTGADQYDNIIREADRALVRVNDAAFDLEPDDIWNPESAHLGGADGPDNISSLTAVTSRMNDITKNVQGAFSDLGDTINSQPEGTWTNRFRDMYAPTLTSANEGVAEGGPVANAVSSTASSGENVNDAFSSFHGAISSARSAIADLYGTDEFGNRYLDTSRTLAVDPSISDPAIAAMMALEDSNGILATAIDPWSISTRLAAGETAGDTSTASTGETSTVSPVSSTGAGGASSGNVGGGTSGETTGSDSALDSLLGAPAQSAPQLQSPMGGGGMPMSAMPSVPSMPTIPNIPDIPTGDNETAAPGDTQLSSDDNAPKDAKPSALSHAAGDSARAATPDSSATTAAAMQSAIPRPGDTVRPGALGADGRPLDKDGDGRMDSDALAATRENADRNGDGFRDEFRFPLNVNGETIDVTCDDPRLAEMMTRLAEGEHGDPVSILDAAKATGLDLEDYGQKIDTLALKPGDVVLGTDTGMYIGEGNVLTEGGEVKRLVDVMDYRISNPEVYRLDVPELPSSDDVIPVVPEQSESPENSTSGPTPEPAPVAAQPDTETPTPEEPSAATAPAPAPDTSATDDALEAMLSGNVETGIQDMEYQGYAMGGPDDPSSSSANTTGIQDVEYQGYAMGGPDDPAAR